jgi:hypothetical protein
MAAAVAMVRQRRAGRMQPIFRVLVNWVEERRVARAEDVDCLCDRLAGLPVFTVPVTGEDGERGGTLDVFVESNRALVDFLNIDCGIKLASRNESCTQRDIVSLGNNAYPDLGLDQIEVERRDLISPEKAIAILRHFLKTGEVIDLVRWPPDDWADEPRSEDAQAFCEPGPFLPDEEIPF